MTDEDAASMGEIVVVTDSLRVELLHDRSQVRVPMVQLTGANTTQFNWCRAKTPNHHSPALWAATHRRRLRAVAAAGALVGTGLAAAARSRS